MCGCKLNGDGKIQSLLDQQYVSCYIASLQVTFDYCIISKFMIESNIIYVSTSNLVQPSFEICCSIQFTCGPGAVAGAGAGAD